jgi:hypothetical protein
MSEKLADRLLQAVQSAAPSLRKIDEEEASQRPGPGKWSKKEILGHLTDSAANNQQRFIRAQQADQLIFPGYQQEEWVGIQDYNSRPWPEMVDLWCLYNRHLAHLIERIPAAKRNVPCKIGLSEPVTLGFLVEDYVRHLNHHLTQLAKPW